MATTDTTQPFGFYNIDKDYLDHIRNNNNEHVPFADYEEHGFARKFYCGPVLTNLGINYYVPVSHRIKDMYLHGSAKNGLREYYGILLQDAYGNKTGCLDFRYLIPCSDDRLLTEHKPNGHAIAQWNFCKTHEEYIKKQASQVFNNIKSKEYPFLNNSAVDDEAALDSMWEYIDFLDEKENQSTQITQEQQDAICRYAKAQGVTNYSNINEKTTSETSIEKK